MATLEFVDICHEETMKAIPVICPQLKNVMFCGDSTFSQSPEGVKTILEEGWPKVFWLIFFLVE